MRRILLHSLWIAILTAVTQVGGLAWLMAMAMRWRWISFAFVYACLSGAAVLVAPMVSGREALPCFGDGPLRAQNFAYCALNRHYVDADLADVARDLAARVAAQHPGTKTRTLDGNFPFFEDFPLLPHLSHDDGGTLDLAFYWQQDGTYLPGRSRSPIGYWGYADGPSTCPPRWDDLRWDMPWLQSQLPQMDLDRPRMRTALSHLSGDDRVSKILIEPHVQAAMGIGHPKIRFQGCRAARHDDHIHIQL